MTSTGIIFITLILIVQSLGFGPAQDEDEGKTWVLLAAGSTGWYNYRHQADVCHAYHIIRNHGIPEEQIIVFMKDDIAYNENNRNPGQLINRPYGPNVYPGVVKDYTEEDLKPHLFLKALQGMETGRKVIKSGPKDHIFVYFSDHGGAKNSEFGDDILYASDLIKAINNMVEEKKFAKMVFYWESCFSGSMFTHLDDDINVFATTAANEHESSYACYFDKHLGVYLGDAYSVNWMENAERSNLFNETLEDQFELVRKETKKYSHVSEWGEMSMGDLPLSSFMGTDGQPILVDENKPILNDMPVKAHDAPKVGLELKVLNAETSEEISKAMDELRSLTINRSKMEKKVDLILRSGFKIMVRKRQNSLNKPEMNWSELTMELEDDCYRPILTSFTSKCYKVGCNSYLTKMFESFADWCQKGYDKNALLDAIDIHCSVPQCGVH